MRISIPVYLLLFLITFNLSGQKISRIEVIESPPTPIPQVCPTDCGDCGKLIFTSFIPDLKFISDMGNIEKDSTESEIYSDGRVKYTYNVVSKALPIQHIIIKGPNISDYDLVVVELGVGTCRDYTVNYVTPAKKQLYWLGATLLSGGTAGYFKIMADKKYLEYVNSAESDERTELQKTIKLYDKLTWVFTGVAAFCAVEFTIQTVKKGKEKNKYQVMLNGSGVKFVMNF